MNICLFSEDEITQPLASRDGRARHILRTLHKGEGDSFVAGIVGGAEGTAVITKVEDGRVFFDFTAERESPPLFPLVMIIGFPRPIQLRRILRDMASLGVREVRLTGTDLGEKSYLASGLSSPDEMRGFLIDGAAQARSTRVPEVSVYRKLDACLEGAPACARLFALDNAEPEGSLRAALSGSAPLEPAVCAVGSERGWTPRERDVLRKHGFRLLSLGRRVLRTETACTAGAAIILSAMGALDL